MNNFPDISFAPWSCPLFQCYTMMSWRGSDEDQTGPGLRIQLSLSTACEETRQPAIYCSVTQIQAPLDFNMCSEDVCICVAAIWETPLSQSEWKRTTLSFLTCKKEKGSVWISNSLRCFSLSPFKKSSVLNMLFAQSGFVPELHC